MEPRVMNSPIDYKTTSEVEEMPFLFDFHVIISLICDNNRFVNGKELIKLPS